MIALRPLLFLLFGFLLSLPLSAQLYLGGTAGSSILYPGYLRANLTLEYALSSNFSIRTGPGFTIRSNRALVRKIELDPDISSASSSYWSLPVNLKGQLGFKKFQLYGLAGLELGIGHRVYYVYIKEKNYYNGRSSFRSFGLNNFDLGVNAGFGIQRLVGKGRIIFMDYRFYLGLTDLDPADALTIYNESQGLSVGMLIPISPNSNDD
jgi:hypothetical protein